MSHSTAPEPEFVDVAAVTTAVVRGRVRMDELPAFFDRSFAQLAATLGQQGVEIVGPALGLYHGQPTESVDLEIGFATASPVQPAGDVDVGSLPGGRVARLVHHGGYDELSASWERLRAWMDARAVAPGPMFWEVYVTEPSPDMDPTDLRTELNWPLAD